MFWKSLNWIQDNWKTIATLGIPILLSFIVSLLRGNRSLEKKVELKESENQIEKDAGALELLALEHAIEERKKAVDTANAVHETLVNQVKDDMQKRFEEITSAEEATKEIQEKLAEPQVPSWKLVTPADIKPPKYPAPFSTNVNRKCPCGSGYKYKYCHMKYWTEK